MTIQETLNQGKKILNENNIEDASLITRMLLSYMLKCKKEELLIKQYETLEGSQVKEFLSGIEKICKGYPLQYITNTKEFMKMVFFVDENVLVPRNDTEILVEEVISIAQSQGKKDILELCTGSGIIAISLEKYIENDGNDELYDYKLWCFSGKVKYIQFLSGRNLNGLKMAFYDRDWNKQ